MEDLRAGAGHSLYIFLYYLFIYNIYNVYRIYNIYNIYYIFAGGQPEPESAGGVHQRGGGAGVRPGLVTRCYEDDLSLLILGGQRSLYQCSGQVHGGRGSAPSAGEARGVNDGLSNCKQKSTIKSPSSARVAGLEAAWGDGGARRPGPVRPLPQHCQ